MIRNMRIPLCLLSMLMCSAAYAQNSSSSSSGSSFTMSKSASNQRIASVQGRNTSLGKANSPKKSGPKQAQTHVVGNGDTLWDLSSQYLSDPNMWPALWSYNPQITNPHWIYPGDTIFLEPQPDNDVALLSDTPAFSEEEPVFASVITVPGFYIKELPKSRGHILYSDQEKHMLSQLDEVQIDFVDINMRKKIQNGQRFTVFKESKPVLNEDGDPMAYKLVRLGTIEVIDSQEKTFSTARIVELSREIERGNLIIPEEDLAFTIERKPNSKSMEGKIIDTIDLISQLSEEQYVIINRGTDDGVSRGNQWVIFEQREGLNRLPQGTQTHTKYAEQNRKDDIRDGEIERENDRGWIFGSAPEPPEFPARSDQLEEIYGEREYTTDDLPLRKIGEILVVDAREKFSTGIIVDGIREVGIDTRVVMIKGY